MSGGNLYNWILIYLMLLTTQEGKTTDDKLEMNPQIYDFFSINFLLIPCLTMGEKIMENDEKLFKI